jgi:hypothetical protein
LVPNYDITQPKSDIQGLYCDTDPEENKRLRFYFTASTFSYVYQALLVTKDINNNGQIGEGEYYWESFIYYSSSWFLGLLNNYINRFYDIID